MPNLSLAMGWRLVVLATAVLVALGFAPAALAQQVTVPEDSSLTNREYADLGVPDPTSEWTVNEYEEALRIFGELPRSKLPRAGSEHSQLLFDRLLISYERAFDLVYRSVPTDEKALASPPPSLPQLYSTTHEDHLLFDRELVAIRARTLSRSIKTLSTRGQLSALAKQFAQRMEAASSEPDRTRLSDRVQKAEETAARVSSQVKDQASELLAIAGIPEIGVRARQELLESAEELFPHLTEFLSEEDVRWVAALLRGAASPEFNSAIRPGLLKLADDMDGARSKT